MKSILILSLVLAFLLTGVNTIKIANHRTQAKSGLISLMHYEMKKDMTDEEIANDPTAQYFVWMMQHPNLINRLTNGTSTEDDRQAIKQQFIDHPLAFVSMMESYPLGQGCFKKMSNDDQKSRLALIIIQNTDFAKLDSKDKKYTDDQVQAIKQSLSNDQDFSSIVDACVDSLNKNKK